RTDPSPLPLVLMRGTATAATPRARRAPPGLAGPVRLAVEDGPVPEGTCRAAGTYVVSAGEGTISVTEAGADGSGTATDAGPAEVRGTCRLDVHAASLLLVGGRTLADARRLGLRADADP